MAKLGTLEQIQVSFRRGWRAVRGRRWRCWAGPGHKAGLGSHGVEAALGLQVGGGA